jgi:type VI secretion system secreted protein VgrG
MSTYTQAGRPLAIRTPLGPDALLLTTLEGHEEVSGLFRFRLRLIADRRTPVPFDGILGKEATVALEALPEGTRWINGIVCRLSQDGRDETFLHYEAELVPRAWLLTRKVRSRIFQRKTVPEILDEVLAGVPRKMKIGGTYEPRDYCTQYRESDFAFASRLMEEEGIRYYFVHTEDAHEMVVTDEPLQHPDVPGAGDVRYDEVGGPGHQDEAQVRSWRKSQQVRSSLTTLRDHCFELPGQSLEAQQATIDSVPVGEVPHRLKVVPGDELEVYDYPGGYARRFDGVGSGGAPRPEELEKVFPDGLRTVRIRMEQEEMEAFEIRGEGTCRHFTAGHRFTLARHFDANGPYLLTRVEHRARLDGDYRSGESPAFSYENRFTAIPAALPCRPPRRTPRPVLAGTQTATVVGPEGEELCCDKYGRVKVQFHWDREGKKDLGSSCWVRVAQTWAGKGWGAFFWPRVGNEVVVAFEEGDPDQPIIVGSVYNAENMPPFPLPLRKELAGFKSASVRGFANQHFNGLVFVDSKGGEHLAIHSQRTMTFNSELDKSFHSGRNKHETVSGFSTHTVGSLAGGGGGGGGPTTEERLTALENRTDQEILVTNQGNTSYHPFGFVQPTGTIGLQAATVFGENLSVVTGLNHSFTLGSSLTFCLNPFALARQCGWELPPVLGAAAGSGFGGAATFVAGTNTTFVLGTNYNVFAEATKDIDVSGHKASQILFGILAAVSVVFLIAYGILAWDIARTIFITVYEALVAALLLALMTIVAGLEKSNDRWDSDLTDFFGAAFGESGSRDWKTKTKGAVEVLAILAAAFVPIFLAGGTTLFAGIAKQAEG